MAHGDNRLLVSRLIAPTGPPPQAEVPHPQLCPRGLPKKTAQHHDDDFKLPQMKGNQKREIASWGSGPLFLNLNPTSSSSALDKFHTLYEQVSEHDRLIVDRMMRKRRLEMAMVQESQLARRYWEEERRQRQHELLEQKEVMTRTMRERRAQDTRETMLRLENLRNRDRFLTDRLKEELEAKEFLLDMRLHKLNTIRDHQAQEKRQQHWEKAQVIACNNEEASLDQRLQQQMIMDQLEERTHRAESQRQRYIEAQRARVHLDNELEQRLHQSRVWENQRADEYQRQRLMDTIRRSDQKTRQVLTNKQRELEDSRSHARKSAFLREFVRRSFTPEVNSVLGTGRLFSNRSFRSV